MKASEPITCPTVIPWPYLWPPLHWILARAFPAIPHAFHCACMPPACLPLQLQGPANPMPACVINPNHLRGASTPRTCCYQKLAAVLFLFFSVVPKLAPIGHKHAGPHETIVTSCSSTFYSVDLRLILSFASPPKSRWLPSSRNAIMT